MRFLLIVAGLLVSSFASAQVPDAHQVRANRVIGSVILPFYRDVGQAAKAHQDIWAAVCKGNGTVLALQQSYGALADSWHRIEFLRYGPISDDFRLERVNFWPDRRNATAKGIMTLLDPASPAPTLDVLMIQSAAVQGLPVLERLIYAQPPDQKPFSKPDPRLCQLAGSISQNLIRMMDATVSEWQIVQQKAATDPALAQEIVTRITTDAVAIYENLNDAKLMPALGKAPEEARAGLLEGAREKRSRAPFEAALLGQIAVVTALGGDSDETRSLTAHLQSALALVHRLPQDLGPMLATRSGWSSGLLLKDSLKGLQDIISASLPELVGVTIGFNSNDGD